MAKLGSIVDGTWSYLVESHLQSAASGQRFSERLTVEELIDLIELAPREEWAEAVMAAQPSDGAPLTEIAFRFARPILTVAAIAFGLMWFGRRRRARTE